MEKNGDGIPGKKIRCSRTKRALGEEGRCLAEVEV